MIGIEQVWGAVGFAAGVCIGVGCMILAAILDDWPGKRRRGGDS